MAKERLDSLLVKRGLASSRERAKALILAGEVAVTEPKDQSFAEETAESVAQKGSVCQYKKAENIPMRAWKPSSLVEEDAQIVLTGTPLAYVSRGGLKLEKAIVQYNLSLHGKVCMDVGASTGGFTDCMLQNGAAKVYAVDVGTDQLAEKLRKDSRVVSMEQTNIRGVTKEDIGEEIDFVSIDVAFISLTLVLAPVYTLMRNGAEIVCLIKPQFEAGRQGVGKKGVVKDPKVHEEVICNVCAFAKELGFAPLHLTHSPIRGPEGNIEYLLHAKKEAMREELETDQVETNYVEADSAETDPAWETVFLNIKKVVAGAHAELREK